MFVARGSGRWLRHQAGDGAMIGGQNPRRGSHERDCGGENTRKGPNFHRVFSHGTNGSVQLLSFLQVVRLAGVVPDRLIVREVIRPFSHEVGRGIVREAHRFNRGETQG